MIRHGVALACCAFVAIVGTACSNNTPTTPSPTTPAPFTSPITATFPGVLGPGGTLSRSFTAQLDGTARAAITGINPPTALGLGIGITRADGTGCLLTYATTASNLASAELSSGVAPGVFCIQVFAPATAAETVRFDVSLTHP